MTLCEVAFVLWLWNYRIAHHIFSFRTVLGSLIVLGMATALYYAGRVHLKLARAIEPVTPLTRANIGDLPAPQTLVRASQEPMQEHQAELLRAAQYGKETHAEELLRATTTDGQDT
jgi:hypothetical protein